MDDYGYGLIIGGFWLIRGRRAYRLARHGVTGRREPSRIDAPSREQQTSFTRSSPAPPKLTATQTKGGAQ